MNISSQFVVFVLDDQKYALHLSAVERVVHVVEITPLPKAPDIVLGIVNVQGRVIPIINVRQRFRLPERDLNLTDQLIISHTSNRAVAMLVDSVIGVIERLEEGIIAAEKILPHLDYVEGVAKLETDIVLIHNLDKFLSLEEEKTLNEAMKETAKK